MGRLVMSFRGLCLHLHHDQVKLPEGVKHRVVALNADMETRTAAWGNLPPHRSFIEVAKTVGAALAPSGLSLDDDRVRVQGANLSVVNSVGMETLDVIGIVPRLTAFKKDTKLRPELYEDPDIPSNSDCYVDMRHGVVVASRFLEGGVYTTWIVETDGDPVLRFARKDADEEIVLTVTIPSTPNRMAVSDDVPGSIVLANGTRDKSDESNDFVLHYLARVGGIPASFDEPFPGEQPTSKTTPVIDFGKTTSCSNSAFP